MVKYDICIIGSGPGGYVAALDAAGQGLKVCLIEKGAIGGVCLNWGCIPTKAYVSSARMFSAAKNAGAYGVNSGSVSLNFSNVRTRARTVVSTLVSGIQFLLKSKKVDVICGEAVLSDNTHIIVNGQSIETSYIIIATGSRPLELPDIKIDEKSVLSNVGLLSLESVPKELLIIGGGVIGCEFASIFNILGSKVTVIELKERLLPGMDSELGRRLESIFTRQSIEIKTGVKVVSRKYLVEGKVEFELSNNEKLVAEKALLSIGRKPIVEGIGLEKSGVIFDEKGIKVDRYMRTNVKNVFAIGDCTGKSMLAHVASYEAGVACQNIRGNNKEADYSSVPSAVYTTPEIASCGMTEENAKVSGIDSGVAKFLMRSLGKAHTQGNTEGYVKLIYDKKTYKLLGADIIGDNASELISEACLAVKNGLTVKNIASTIHAHPTMSEALLEAAHIAEGNPIHSLP